MRPKSVQWQKKIDPGFHKIIRLYREALVVSKLPGNIGYIALDTKPYKMMELEDFPTIAPFYEHYKLDAQALDLALLLGEDQASSKRRMKTTKKETRKQGGIFNVFSEMIKTLPEESNAYYRKHFLPLIEKGDKGKHREQYLSTLSPDDQKRLVGDMHSLLFHIQTIEVESKRPELKEKGLPPVGPHVTSRVIKNNIFGTYDLISLIVNGKGIKKLFMDAKKGSDAALFKLIKVDKTLFDHDWVRKRIRKALYAGDGAFFVSLGSAIQDDPLKDRKNVSEIFPILLNFWNYGLYRLNIPEMEKLFEDSGIKIYDDQESFRQCVRRVKKSFLTA